MITALKAKQKQFELKLLNDYIDIEMNKIEEEINMASAQGLGFIYYYLHDKDFRNNMINDIVTYIHNVLTRPDISYEVNITRYGMTNDDYYKLKIIWNKLNKD